MRQRQENLICKHFQEDVLSEERKDLGKSYVRIFKGPFTTTRWASCDDTTTELNIDEKHTVTYICGSILKKLTTKFFDLKRKTKAEIHPSLQKQISIIGECKEVVGAVSINRNNKLIDTLSRGGLVYPKKQFVDIFFKVESIFRGCFSKTSRSINTEEIVAKCFEGSSISDQFFNITEPVAATDEEKCQLLRSCIGLYIKIRSFGHTKNTIESYHSATQTEKKTESPEERYQEEIRC